MDVCDCGQLDPHVHRAVGSPSSTLFFCLETKGSYRSLTPGATGRYVFGSHVTVNSHFMAVVIVLISWRLDCGVTELQ